MGHVRKFNLPSVLPTDGTVGQLYSHRRVYVSTGTTADWRHMKRTITTNQRLLWMYNGRCAGM